VEHLLNSALLYFSSLAGKLKSVEQVGEVVRKGKDAVSEGKDMAEFFELLG